MPENKTVHLALGTNIGNREQNLELALDEISEFGEIKAKSSLHETEPWGYKQQNKFLNMAIEIETDLKPIDLLARIHEIEHKMGRTKEIKNGPRIIDIDILLYEDQIIDKKTLKVPHPRMHKRKFVLDPLEEIAANKVHPELNKSITKLNESL